MINDSIYQYLLDLRENNNRDWFHANKAQYNKAKADFEVFVALSIEQIKQIDPLVAGVNAKDCIFRISRDTRFSNNKLPYKTNFGAFISQEGRKSKYGGYYIHVEPEQSFLAGGCYMPEPKILKAIREEIYHHPNEFKTIIEAPKFVKHFPELHGDKLKTAPRGYSKDFEHIHLLNYKHYVVSKFISDDLVNSDKFPLEIQETFEALYPLNQFLNNIIEDL